MSGRFPYENTDTTGDTGRATARGLDRLDFSPIVLLLFGGLLLLVVGVWIFNFQAREPGLKDRQFAVLEEALRESPEGKQGRLEIPPQEDWSYSSHGHVDEWSGAVVLASEGSERTDRILVDFNVKTGPTEMRKRDWIDASP